MIMVHDFKYDTQLLSEKAYNEHLKLYHSYVTKTNELITELPKLQQDKANHNYSMYRSAKKELSYCLNGITLHELYFKNISNGSKHPNNTFVSAILDFNKWYDDFISTALSARGFVLCCFEQRTGRIQNILMDTYSDDYVVNSYPLIALDMYEHSFYIDYMSDRKKYVAKFMQCINWDVVERRAKNIFEEA